MTYRAKRISQAKEKELYKRLYLSLFGIVLSLALIYVSLKYFGPKIGAFFGLISINRNDTAPKDSLAPPPPVFTEAPEATSSEKMNLSGLAEQGTVVKLYVNGPVKGTAIADKEGSFTFPEIKLNVGKNIIFAKAQDKDGNISEKSETLYVEVDKKKPEITINTPSDGEIVKNLDKRIRVEGKVNEKATVKVNDKIAVVNADNSFEILLGTKEGDLEIKVEAFDTAGNKNEKIIHVKYEKTS